MEGVSGEDLAGMSLLLNSCLGPLDPRDGELVFDVVGEEGLFEPQRHIFVE